MKDQRDSFSVANSHEAAFLNGETPFKYSSFDEDLKAQRISSFLTHNRTRSLRLLGVNWDSIWHQPKAERRFISGSTQEQPYRRRHLSQVSSEPETYIEKSIKPETIEYAIGHESFIEQTQGRL